MKRQISFLVAISLLIFSCTSNPLSGKKQMTLLPESELQKMATEQYQTFLISQKVISLSSGIAGASSVKRVSDRIIQAVQKYYQEKGMSKELTGYKWEVNLVNDNTVNAWCMPGGKIVVYTGLLPVTINDAALAVVIGHEVSHALLQHGNQRMSQGLLQQLGGVALSVAVANKPKETQDVFLNAYGTGTQVGVLLPFSRKHELEADKFGLIFAAMAGYDPRESINLWQRMESLSTSNKPPEFLSTHPSEGKRIEELQKLMPEALKYYNSAKN
jgi:predicted Zn-dependent protease